MALEILQLFDKRLSEEYCVKDNNPDSVSRRKQLIIIKLLQGTGGYAMFHQCFDLTLYIKEKRKWFPGDMSPLLSFEYL